MKKRCSFFLIFLSLLGYRQAGQCFPDIKRGCIKLESSFVLIHPLLSLIHIWHGCRTGYGWCGLYGTLYGRRVHHRLEMCIRDRHKLEEAGLKFHMKGRTKSIHSIYQKMKKQKCPFEGAVSYTHLGNDSPRFVIRVLSNRK